MKPLKQTPLVSYHRELGATMAEYASFEMPIVYTSIQEEHNTVRQHVGIFDVSHMGEIQIMGKDATAFVESFFTNNVKDVQNGKVVYGFICNEDGGVIDDLLIYKYHDEKFLLVVNAANREKDLEVIVQRKGSFDVAIEDISDQIGLIAIQGPKSEQVLQRLTDEDLTQIKPYSFKEDVKVMGLRTMISRTGYTGEDGFEVYTESEDVVALWLKLLEIGADEGLKPIGLGARDTLRFEAGLPLYGNELSDTITPIEAGLKPFVKFDHDFIGKEALQRQVEEGVTRKVVGLKLHEKGIVRQGYRVFNELGEEIGMVTTGYLLPGYPLGLACALIDVKESNIGNPVYVEMRKKRLKAEVTGKRFLTK